MKKKLFTTGQVAKVCKVAPRTVSKWFDSGRLRGFRIPGSQDRRIPREHLERFLKEHGMPDLPADDDIALIILPPGTSQPEDPLPLLRRLRMDPQQKVEYATGVFDGGLRLVTVKPVSVILVGEYEGSSPEAIETAAEQIEAKFHRVASL